MKLTICLLLYLAYLAVAIVGLFKSNSVPSFCDLSDPDVPYGKFCVVDEKYYERDMWVTMVVKHKQPFDFQLSYSEVTSLLNTVHSSGQVKADRTINWMNDYSDFKSTDPSVVNFVENKPIYQNDILVDKDNVSVTTSRIYLQSVDISTSSKAQDIIFFDHLFNYKPLTMNTRHRAVSMFYNIIIFQTFYQKFYDQT